MWHYLHEVKYCHEIVLELRGRPVHVVIRDGELGRRDTPQLYYLQEVKYYQELVFRTQGHPVQVVIRDDELGRKDILIGS